MQKTNSKSLIGEKEFQNYKNFAFRDDMFKLSVGIILGNSFNKVIYGMSDYLIMPIFTFLISKTGQRWREWEFTPIYGLTFELGNLLGTFVDFLLISLMLYLFYIKFVQKIMKYEQPNLKQCNFCFSNININAIKCPMCTGDLNVKKRRNRRKNQRAKNN